MGKENILESTIFKAFADASDNVYIYVTDVSTGKSRWSESAIKFFDLPGEYMNNPIKIWSEKIHPNDRRSFLDDIEAVFSGQVKNHCCQYRALNRYGQYVWLECRGTMIYDDDNNMTVFAGMMTRLDSQSKFDPLTGLLSKNEYYNFDFTQNSGVVMLLGADHFRKVNVTYGYKYGEDVLAELGKILTESCDIYKKIYRFNGDEFMMIFPEINKTIAEEIFKNISEKSNKVEMKDGRFLNISFTAGAIEYPAFDGNKDDILNYLEITLDYAKHINKGGICFFDNVIKEKQSRANEIKKDIKTSIANNFEGFELYYQPWIDARGIKIVGCEALLRWKGEHIKDAGPAEFIPIIEETNDIVEVGRFVMREAMKQQKEWQDKYGDFKVSFNVSYRQFLVKEFVDELLITAQELGVKTNNIILELTESCDVETPENLALIFETIRSYGFEIALDDFGTGYSSMELLKKLPANDIKIEHNFVRELEKTGHGVDFAIIEAILLLCKRVNCGVVVEGVENEEVDEIVRGMDVNYLQGYYYSKPICKSDFEKLVNENRNIS